jgi:putative nucleotidyltransferase with HDIG domain
MEMADNPKTSAARLGSVIATDQALTAKVLKIANSPFYGFPKRISTVEFAIIVLGFEALKEIVLSIAMMSSIQKGVDEVFDAKVYWDHAITTGSIARRLAQDTGYRVTGEAFVGGLLHDMGVSVAHRYFRKEFEEVVRTIRSTPATFEETEKKVIGATHAEIGGWLAERWNLPDHLAESIALHHSPASAGKNPHLTAIVHCADILAVRLTAHPPEFDQRSLPDEGALNTLGFDSFDSIMSYAHEMMEDERPVKRPLYPPVVRSQS